jgi:DNA-binding CsgD family transcriptional regulator
MRRQVMAASGLVRERDLRALTAVVEDGLRDHPGPAMPWVVLDQKIQLIPGEDVGFTEYDLRKQQPITLQSVEEGGERSVERDFTAGPPYPDYWMHRQQFLPNRYVDTSGDVTSVLRWSDFYAPPQLRNAAFYAEFLGPMAHRHGLYVPLPARPGVLRRLVFIRKSEPDFSDNELLVLRLLRPHLHEVYLDAERRRHGIPHLSHREREVLQLVAQSYSNADIARILFISAATVAKHMEHIFDRTGVRTRSAAAALVLPKVRPFTQPPHQTGRRAAV